MSRLRLITAVFAVLAAAVALIGVPAGRGAAHPLGNFTVNHYTRIDITAEQVEVLRVLDLAEIPALQELQQLGADGDGEPHRAAIDAFAAARARELADGMELLIDGERVDLDVATTRLELPEGQAGLRTMRLEARYTSELPDRWREGAQVSFEDTNDLDRLGWREVVVRGGPGVDLTGSTAPSASLSDELHNYPDASLSSPPDIRSVRAEIAAGAGAPLPATAPHPQADAAVRGNPDSTLNRFTDLVARDNLGWGAVALALMAAVGFGAIHALSPGHGKTIVAAYLVGSRGTWKHALFLAGVVTVTHTSSVYALGFVALYFSNYVLAEDLYPWLGVSSGLLVLAMGLALFGGRMRASGLTTSAWRWLRSAVPRLSSRRLASEKGALVLAGYTTQTAHQHDHDLLTDGNATHSHDHDHDEADAHSHGFGRHSHRIPGQDGEPITLKGLVGLGVFGGMIPCPSAIVVMLSAIALGRVAFGLVLIVAFSVGLAVVLSAIGFALVLGRGLSERSSTVASLAERITASAGGALVIRLVPVMAALAVAAAGALITARAMQQL